MIGMFISGAFFGALMTLAIIMFGGGENGNS